MSSTYWDKIDADATVETLVGALWPIFRTSVPKVRKDFFSIEKNVFSKVLKTVNFFLT